MNGEDNSPVPDTVCGHRQRHSGCYCSLPCPGWRGSRHFEAETLDSCKHKDAASETLLYKKGRSARTPLQGTVSANPSAPEGMVSANPSAPEGTVSANPSAQKAQSVLFYLGH